MTIRDLVWKWLVQQSSTRARQTYYLSDVTKGLCGKSRRINRLSTAPRDDIRTALAQLQAEGLVSLSPTPSPGRGGMPGTLININHEPLTERTQERMT